jgi:hypothetical protein
MCRYCSMTVHMDSHRQQSWEADRTELTRYVAIRGKYPEEYSGLGRKTSLIVHPPNTASNGPL